MKRKLLVVLTLLVMSLSLIFTYVDTENHMAKDPEFEWHGIEDPEIYS